MDINEMKWIPIKGFPGYEISEYGPVCKVRKDGTRQYVNHYKDRTMKNNWVYVTLWKNCTFHQIALRDLVRDNLKNRTRPVQQETVVEKPGSRFKKRTSNPEEQSRKFKEMIDGFDPHKMSSSAYMKYLREQGYKFTTSHLSAALTKKKDEMKKDMSFVPKLF